MNQSYRLIFNKSMQVWQVVSELAKSHSKSSAKLALPLVLLLAQNALAELNINALPTGGMVVAGQSHISQSNNQLSITQTTQKSIINWNSYNIGANATVNYVQPNSSAISLNRVTSQNPSQIFGKLNANGQVWLINPNGVLFGQSAQVNVGGLLVSTLNITDDDFLNSNYKFTGNSGGLVNMGNIVANNGGYVAMFSPQIRNEGIISAMQGTSILAAGNAITMDFAGNGLINVQVDSANVNTLIENKHLIKVGGGQVLMSTRAADNLMTSVINNSGRIEANSMVSEGGRVRLLGAQTVINSGEISATSSAGKGGSVHLLGENVGVFDNGSINVNGKTGGGTILVGGDFQGKNANIQNAQKTFISQNARLSADALDTGNGGKVIVWANDIARYYGSISAKGGAIPINTREGAFGGNGGFVEVSGKRMLNFLGKVDLSANNGIGGQLLLDPTNITISNGLDANTAGFSVIPLDITEAFAEDSGLDSNFNVITSFLGISAGSTITLQAENNISVQNAFNLATATGAADINLVLQANNNISVLGGATITASGNGSISLIADANNDNTGNVSLNAGLVSSTGGINLSGATISGSAGGTINTNGLINVNVSAIGSLLLGVVSGTGSLTKNGAGSLNLSGNNTYTGLTTVNTGTLVAGSNNALGSTAGTTIVQNGATLALRNSITVAEAITFTGSGAAGIGALNNINNNNTLTGAITLGAGGALFTSDIGSLTLSGASDITGANQPLTIGGAGTSTISKSIVIGSGTLTKIGTGTLTLSGNNNYTGATNINAGILIDGAAIPNNSAVNIAAGATLNLNNQSEIVGSIAGAGNIIMGTAALSTGANNLSTNFSGVISSAAIGDFFNKDGTGTLTLAGVNTYSGVTRVRAGTLSASNTNALGATDAGTTVFNNATLNVDNVSLVAEPIIISGNGATGSFGALTGTGAATVTGSVTTTAASRIGTSSAASSLTINGAISSALNAINVAGAGNISATNITNDFGSVSITNAGNVTLVDANNITFTTSTLTGNLTAQALGNITLNNAISSSGGNITLASINFINNAGALALSAAGRWLVYTSTPIGNTFGGLNSANQALWGVSYPNAVTATGNRYIFANSPNVIVQSTDQSKTYGQDSALIVANAYTATGFVNAALFGNVFTQDTAINALVGSATSIGSASAANVGNYAIDVTPINATTGYGLTLLNAGNLTVNPAGLTITANNQTKTYGNTFTFAGAEFTNTEFTNSALQNNETVGFVTLASTGAISTANVGNYSIGASAASGGTFSASNYNITYSDGNMQVDPATINLNGARTYNASTLFNGGDFSLVNGVLGQTLNVSGTGSVLNKNVSAAQALSLGTLSLSNNTGLASNYTLTGGTHTGTISQASLSLNAVTDSKIYDGNTNSAGNVNVVGLSGADTIVATQSFGSKNVLGSNVSTLNVNGGFVINDGNTGANYAVSTTSASGTISPLALVGTVSINNKVYDGNNLASIASRNLTGVIAGEAVTYTGSAATFADKNAGTSKTVTSTGLSISGTDAGNYTVNNSATTLANISQLAITGAITANDKVYDGNNLASIASRNLTGVIAGDTVNYTGGSATFNDKNVATGKTVTGTGLALIGADAGNYTVNSTATTTADISQLAILGTITANNKTYDGSNTAAIASRTLNGVVTGDAVIYAGGVATFADKNAAIGKTVTSTGLALIGADAGNYTVNSSAIATADISKATLALNAVTDTKMYDGNAISTSVVAANGLISGDIVTASQSFDSKDAGVRVLVVNADFMVSDGNSGNNYAVTTNSNFGSITPASLTLTANDITKTYGQTVNFTGSEFTSIGLIGIETIANVSLLSAGAQNNASVAASPYAITASNAAGGSFNASNYAINYVGGNLIVNRAPLIIAANNASKTQGSANPAFSSIFTGLVNGETNAALTGALMHSTQALTSSPAGIYAITPFGVTADNYAISFLSSALTVGSSTNISLLNGTLTRPEQAVLACASAANTSNAMISGLEAFSINNVEYQESVSQPLVAKAVANALVSPSCL